MTPTNDAQLDALLGDDADGGTLARLHLRLTERAEEAGALDVAYRTLDTPIGTLLLAATDAGLVLVTFGGDAPDAALERLATDVSPRILAAPRRLDAAARELDEYFAGKRRRFDLPLDFRLARGFRRAVLDRLRAIRFGDTASYAAIAAAAGSPRAVRAVGSACATNPLLVVVPCHRVIRSDGALGEYAGGTERKRTLLELERAAA